MGHEKETGVDEIERDIRRKIVEIVALENQRTAVSRRKSEFVLARAEEYEVPLFFHYPSEEYISYLMTVDELEFCDEIACGDLSEGNNLREKIMIFALPDYKNGNGI